MSPEQQVKEAKRVERKLEGQKKASSVQALLNQLPPNGKRASTYLRKLTAEERQKTVEILKQVDSLGGQS